MAPKVVDVDLDGTHSETDNKPSDHQIPSAPAIDESNTSESKTCDIAATPPTDTTENIPQKEEVASAHEPYGGSPGTHPVPGCQIRSPGPEINSTQLGNIHFVPPLYWEE